MVSRIIWVSSQVIVGKWMETKLVNHSHLGEWYERVIKLVKAGYYFARSLLLCHVIFQVASKAHGNICNAPFAV